MDVSWMWGYAKTAFYHSSTPISIPLKKSNGTIDMKTETPSSSITLVDLCKDVTPPCRLNPLLFNGHLQTLWTTQTRTDIPIHYRRRIFTSNDHSYPGTFAVDFLSHNPSTSIEADTTLPPRTAYYTDSEWAVIDKGSDDTTPMLIALHGLSGGSHELYLRYVLDPLVNPANVQEQRWEALVVNARGCAKSKITSPIIFNARATWDMRQVVRWVREKFPSRPLFAVGFSLGANILVDVCSLLASPKYITIKIFTIKMCAVLIPCVCSISVRKAKLVNSELQSSARIRGTCMREVLRCKGVG